MSAQPAAAGGSLPLQPVTDITASGADFMDRAVY
jgi:hypothetical protein